MKTHDHEHAFRGTWDTDPEGRCRVRILQERDGPPIIITELVDNPSTSVTTMIEHLVPELIVAHFPHRFEVIDEPPAIVVEHYEGPVGPVRAQWETPEYSLVTFAHWRPRTVWLGGQQRLSLGEPEWRHMPDLAVRLLLGREADDLMRRRSEA